MFPLKQRQSVRLGTSKFQPVGNDEVGALSSKCSVSRGSVPLRDISTAPSHARILLAVYYHAIIRFETATTAYRSFLPPIASNWNTHHKQFGRELKLASGRPYAHGFKYVKPRSGEASTQSAQSLATLSRHGERFRTKVMTKPCPRP